MEQAMRLNLLNKIDDSINLHKWSDIRLTEGDLFAIIKR